MTFFRIFFSLVSVFQGHFSSAESWRGSSINRRGPTVVVGWGCSWGRRSALRTSACLQIKGPGGAFREALPHHQNQGWHQVCWPGPPGSSSSPSPTPCPPKSASWEEKETSQLGPKFQGVIWLKKPPSPHCIHPQPTRDVLTSPRCVLP